MNKYDILKEIFEFEDISVKIKKCPLITEEKLLVALSKTKYKLNEELNISAATTTKYIKILFPDRETSNTKIDNWLLDKYDYKQCKNCGKVKLTEDFPTNSSRSDGIGSYCKECYLENTRDYQREYQKRRKLLKISRIPKWANIEKIKEIYYNCPEGMHVDHIIPLQGKLVSGLHVHNNLQYLSIKDNCSKRNKFEID